MYSSGAETAFPSGRQKDSSEGVERALEPQVVSASLDTKRSGGSHRRRQTGTPSSDKEKWVNSYPSRVSYEASRTVDQM